MTATREAERRVATQDLAGSVHVAVVSAARWEDYRDALQPQFQLTADEALDRVLAISGTSHTATRTATSVELSGGPTGAIPDGPGKSAAASKPAARKAGGVGEPIKIGTPQSDPVTQYQAAAALYQEVQLLNRYVHDAALKKGYSAYVLRLQIALMPRARNEPYDAYSTISFFSSDSGTNEETGSRGAEEVKADRRAPEVLPLLVTDNLEVSLASRAHEQLRELSIALGATSGVASAGIGASRSVGRLDRSTGLDLNSLLTVARVSGNTLRVRMGAMRQGSTEYAMIPRTHSVTVLVMLPPGAGPYLQLVARTTMVDVRTGVALRDRTPEELEALLSEVGTRYGTPDTELLAELLDLAQRNDTAGFFARVPQGVRHPRALWVDLIRVRIGSQYGSTVVDLQAIPAGEPAGTTLVLPEDQEIGLQDDGTHCTVTLGGGAGIDPSVLRAWLVIGGDRRPARVTIDGDRIRLVFDSIRSRSAEETKGLYVQLQLGKKRAKYRRITRS